MKRAEIDDNKWNHCIQSSGKPFIYGETWYLDTITDNSWCALVFADYEAVFPLPVKSKFALKLIYQPFFCQQLGVFCKPGSEFRYADFLKSIPGYFVRVHLHLNSVLPLPEGIRKKKNYVLGLNRSYESIKDNFNRDALKNLKKCNEAGITVVSVEDFSATIQLYRQVWGGLNPHVQSQHYALFANACAEAQKRGKLLVYQAYADDQLMGSAIFLKSSAYLHYVCAAPTAEGRKAGVMHSIIDTAIREHSGTGFVLDFEGSEIPAVADFYCKFGPEEEFYGVYERKLF